jgi:hypothetical protein
MIRFLPGALAARMQEMGVRTGQLRDRTGLAANAVKDALRTDEAPEDVAAALIAYLGPGLVGGKASAAAKGEATPEFRYEGMTAKEVLAAIDRGDFTAAAAWEREQEAEHPRTTLLRELQARVEAGE